MTVQPPSTLVQCMTNPCAELVELDRRRDVAMRELAAIQAEYSQHMARHREGATPCPKS